MKTVIVIPTYWTRERERGIKLTDVLRDHPTPIDEVGTLGRAVLSLKEIEDRDFTLIVMAAASTESSRKLAEKKVVQILKRCCPQDIPTYVFSHPHLELLERYIKDAGGSEFLRLIDIYGYSDMRNLSLILGQLLDADILISIDDDEYIRDPHFLKTARENIGKKVDGMRVEGITGYYVNPAGDYHVEIPQGEWVKYWNKGDAMNRAFDMLIPNPPRLKRAPFALGGCMVLSRKLMETIPFDPLITRGEDVDYLINTRMFGLEFFFDNKLSVVHDPPPKPHPVWRRFMVDAGRFIYEREKIRAQKDAKVRPVDLDPYPGEFLKDDLDEKILRASTTLYREYMEKGEKESAEIVLDIPRMAAQSAKLNPYTHLVDLKETWGRLSKFILDSGLKAHSELFWEL
jgi:glycosyltransferase involved in cell wall biosynthesis